MWVLWTQIGTPFSSTTVLNIGHSLNCHRLSVSPTIPGVGSPDPVRTRRGKPAGSTVTESASRPAASTKITETSWPPLTSVSVVSPPVIGTPSMRT